MALVLRVLVVGFLRWRVEKGEEDLRRRRGFVDLGIVLRGVCGGVYLCVLFMCLWEAEEVMFWCYLATIRQRSTLRSNLRG